MAIDPGTSAIVASSLLLAKEPLNKLLGPTLDYFGKEIESFAKKRTENIGRIFQKAIDKLGPKIDEPGQVNPKLLKGLILDGSFCDDELTAEYFGGVLASSRSGITRDDRGNTYINLISRLSTYQIRTHFIIYTLMRRLFVGEKLNPGMREDREKMRIYIPFDDYDRAMAFEENEDKNACFIHSWFGLIRENLIHNSGAYGSIQNLQKFYPHRKFSKRGVLVQPSDSGFDFYLWGHGRGEIFPHEFLNPNINLESPQGIEIPTNAFAIIEEFERQEQTAK